MTSRIRPSNRGACLLLVLAAVAGCVPAKRPQPAKAVADAKKEPAKEDKKELPKDELKKDDPAFPPLAAEAALEQAALLLGKGEPDLAKKVLEYLAARKGELNVPQLAEFERLTALAAKSSATSPKEVPAVPKEVPAPKEVPPPTELVEARKLAAAEKWDEALKSLEPFLAKAEEGEPKREATALRDKIQRQLADLRELREAVGQLGASGAEAEVARKRLWRDSERSLPLLLAGLSSDNPAQLGGILEMLRMRNEPKATLPAVVALLERPEASAVWPTAIGELDRMRQPGAGDALLKLASEGKSPEQRAAALAALAAAVDPPQKTLRTLLPVLHQDGPLLAPALSAAARAAMRHRQQDLVTARVLRDGPLSPDEQKLLAALPARLKTLAEGLKVTPRPDTAVPAAMLASALGVTQAPALAGVRVVECSGEEINGPVAAILDGVWENYEPGLKHAWYDVGSIPNPWVVLDLGSTRTVAGLRIWNCDGPGGLADRGWREVDIYVTNDLADTLPAASGFLGKAPGRKNAGDFSDVIPVPFARGRYIKMQARSIWTDQYSGLSEVQVLGW